MEIKLYFICYIKQVIPSKKHFLINLKFFKDLTIDSTISLKIALDIGRGMAFLHGITNSFRPQFILNSHHIMVNRKTDGFL